MAVVFISYRRKDSGGYAGRLHEELVRRYGREAVFMDIDSLHGGVEFRQRIHQALDTSNVALILIGEAWAAPTDDERSRRIDREDDPVRQEVAAALKHEEMSVVPVLVEGASLPATSELPEDLSNLRGLHVCQLRNSDWKSDVRRIIHAIDAASRPSGMSRLIQALRRRPRRVAAAAAGILALLVLVTVIAIAPSGGGGEGCVNQFIPDDAREELADAAGSPQPAVDGSVYYGTCGGKTYAIASFPDGTDGVFVQSGLDWVDLGPVAVEKCARIPRELLESWRLDDC